MQSLDAPRDTGVEDAWDRGIIRRGAAVDSGRV